MAKTRSSRRARGRRRATRAAGRVALALSMTSALVACASPPREPPPERVSTVRLGSRLTDAVSVYDLRHQADVGRATVPAGAPAVWGVLSDVFDQLEIDVSFVDASSGTMGTERFRAGSIEGVRLSRWLDCGMGTMRANADSHQVTMTVLVQLLPGEAGTTVQTTVDAYARDRSQGAGSVHCVSHGRLERRIPELIVERLGLGVPEASG